MASDPRVHVSFRIAAKGWDWITMLALAHGVHRSVVIRHGLAVARKYESEVIERLKEES
jgi:hypothetical protein